MSILVLFKMDRSKTKIHFHLTFPGTKKNRYRIDFFPPFRHSQLVTTSLSFFRFLFYVKTTYTLSSDDSEKKLPTTDLFIMIQCVPQKNVILIKATPLLLYFSNTHRIDLNVCSLMQIWDMLRGKWNSFIKRLTFEIFELLAKYGYQTLYLITCGFHRL